MMTKEENRIRISAATACVFLETMALRNVEIQISAH